MTYIDLSSHKNMIIMKLFFSCSIFKTSFKHSRKPVCETSDSCTGNICNIFNIMYVLMNEIKISARPIRYFFSLKSDDVDLRPLFSSFALSQKIGNVGFQDFAWAQIF